MGLGVGCIFQPTLIALQAHSLKSRRAVIISNRNFYRCAGGACGLAISAAVLQARLRSALPAEYAYLADSTYSIPHFPGGFPVEVLDAYMAASRAVFILQVPLIGLCLLVMVFIRDRGLEPVEDTVAQDVLTLTVQKNFGTVSTNIADLNAVQEKSLHGDVAPGSRSAGQTQPV